MSANMCIQTLRLTQFTVTILTLTATTFAQQQRGTIPETLSRVGRSVTEASTVPSGLPPTIADVLKDAEVIAKGIVGQPRTYLSDDQTDIYTDYELQQSTILYQSEVAASARPGVVSPVTVTIPGGTIEINGLTYQRSWGAVALGNRD